jgi:hypothetical protein
MQYYFDKTFSAFNVEESEGKREAARRILPIIGRLPDRIEQDHWLKELAEKLGVGETALRETLAISRQKEKRPEPAALPPEENRPRRETREEKLTEGLLALIIKFPVFFEYTVERLSLDHIFGAENKEFYRQAIIYYNEVVVDSEGGRLEISYADFRDWLMRQNKGLGKEGLFRLLDKIIILGEKDFFGLEADKAKSEIIKIVGFLKESFLSLRKKEIGRLICDLEKEGNVPEAVRLMGELKRMGDENQDDSSETENI